MGDEFTYYAFVSYSHKDQKWAEWIQNAIEHYRLPAIIRKEAQKQLPKRIAPVFRDATDLGVDVLVDGLHEELEKSRFLIVVCSPNSAKPNAEGKHFVDEEVRHFCELGRTKQVIPVIVEGTPEEAFGPVLKSQEILAINATKFPRARVLNDIVAKILGLKPDALWRRAERERRKRLIIRSILCSILSFFVAVAGYFAWDANRTVKNYYADYVDSFGLPEGLFPLKKSDLTHRHIHYRFEYKGFQHGKSPHADSADWCIWNTFGFRRRLVRVVQANSRGYPRKWDHTEYSDRPQIQDFKYDRDLRLREIRYGRYNGEGREPHLEKRIVLWNLEADRTHAWWGREIVVTNGLSVYFKGNGQLGVLYSAESVMEMLPNFGEKLSARSDISQYAILRDEYGRVTNRLFLNPVGANISDGEGVYGFSYDHDKYGRQVAKWNIFMSGTGFSRDVNKKGVGCKRYEYSGRNLCKVEYVDQDGKLIMGPNGWASHKDSFDSFGNVIEVNIGTAIICHEYNDQGDERKRSFFKLDRTPILNREGCAQMLYEYDELGRMIRERYLDKDGKPSLHKYGFSEVLAQFDENGNVIKESCLDGRGSLIICTTGFAERTAEYDADGNLIRQRYYDTNGGLMVCQDGVADVRYEYDKAKNVRTISYYGTNGEPVWHKNGYSAISWEYDYRGNVNKESFFGTDHKLMKYNGFAFYRIKYNKLGLVEEVAFFDENGNRTLGKDHFAIARLKYDERGNAKSLSFFGVHNEPILHTNGYYQVRWGYNLIGDKIKESYFGEDGRPILCRNRGIATSCIEYDRCKNVIGVSVYGVDGKPVLDNGGCFKRRWEYDARGNKVRESCLGKDGEPILCSDGYAEARLEYNLRGIPITCRFFNESGNEISLRSVVVTKSVLHNSMAEQFGVREGDIWCRIGAYEMTSTDMAKVFEVIDSVRNMEKELMVARKCGSEYEFRMFRFPVGIMGIEVAPQKINDFDKLETAYKTYCEKENGEKK